MTQITKEAIEAARSQMRPFIPPNDETLARALEAALPFLPIAGEGKAPEGWQLVPTVATLEMEHAAVARVKTFHDEDWYRIMPKDLFRLAWKALLGAAPAPPSPTVYANVNDAVLDPTPISPILYTRSSPGKDGGQEVEAVAWRYKVKGEYGWSDWCLVKEVAFLEEYKRDKPSNIVIEPLSTQPASTALVERLTSALQPFAQAADDIERTYGNDLPEWQIQFPQLPMSDFRRARSALSASTSREGESRG